MPRQSATERDILTTARKRFDRAIVAESENRAAAIVDLRFKNGEQWEQSARARREAERRPCLTINKMKTFVHQITNEQRMNRPGINVSPLGDEGNKQTAQVLRGLIRAIERNSDADIAYDTGFESAVSVGFGYWRIVTDWEDERSRDQIIKVLRIRNPFTVYLDPERQQPDASDAMWAFVTEMIPRDEFKGLWPKADPISWDTSGIGDQLRHWADKENIRIAEYFTVEIETRTLLYLANGANVFEDEAAPEVLDRIKSDPSYLVGQRESECRKIMWRKITGKEVLEEQEWPGKWIPVVECVGDEIDIEGRVTRAGIIRDAKDSQRMKNYWATSMTERVALETKSPWVMAEGQIEGHEAEWRNANIESRTVLTYKPTDISGKLVPPPQRQSWMGPPAGVMAAEAQSEQDMMATTGIRFDATKSERTQDESGIALKALQSHQQLGAYHYMDNLSRSLKHTGRIMLDLIPRIYDTQRVLQIINEDGSDERVMVNPSQQEPFNEVERENEKIKSFNPNLGKYDVAVTIGPSYQTMRQEASAGMLEFGKSFPESAPYIADLVAKNQPWPDSDLLAKRLAMTLPPQMLMPEQKNISPQMQALIVALQQQIQQLQQESQQLQQQLIDKNADRAIAQDDVNKDFEAKMAKVATDFETKMASVSANLEKIQASRENALLEHIRAIVTEMRALENPPERSPGANGASHA